MRSLENSLGNWISLKYGDQDAIAQKLGITRAAVSAYKTGRNDIPQKTREALRKLGYTGPWPREEAQEAAGAGPTPSAVSEEVTKLKGRIEALEGQIIAALAGAKFLDERVQRLEKRLGSAG